MSSKRTAIVTGASQGIGAALVEALVNAGYNVVATSRNVNQSLAASSNLVLVAAQCGAIELIGAVRELRYPGQLFGCQRFNIDLQLQPREESLQRWGFLAKAVALPVLAVERGALMVLFGNLLFVECPDVLKEVRNCLRLIRKL